MLIYRQNINWILDKDNNAILGNDDNTGISNTESSECDAYVRETDDTELLEYVLYAPFFLLDDKNNVILKDDDTGIILNYGESLSDHDYTPFAVYSDTDNSLIFYYDTQPSVGDIYNTRTVTDIYTGWDTETYTSESSVPWYSQRTNIEYVSFNRTFANKVYPVSIAYWFYGFTNITDFNFDNLDTRYTTNMISTFNGCSSIIILDLRSFDTLNVTSYSNFAVNCDSLEEILLCSSFDLFVKSTNALVTQQYWKDSDNNVLPDYLIGVQEDIDCFITQKILAFAIYSEDDNSLTFYYDHVPEVGDVYKNKTVTDVYTGFETATYDYTEEGWGEDGAPPWTSIRTSITSVKFDKTFQNVKLKSLSYWFYNFTSCTSIDLTYLDTSTVTSTAYTFYNNQISTLNMSYFDTSNITSFSGMFYGCSHLVELDGKKFNTSNVRYFDYMFRNCARLAELDVSTWDVSRAINMYEMFYQCTNLTKVDVSNWNISSSMNNIGYMFSGCSSLTELDVSNWCTSNVTRMDYFVGNCTSLKTIYSDDNKFVISDNLQYGQNVFINDTSLVGGNGTMYEVGKINYRMAHVDTEDNPGYFTSKPAFAVYSTTDNSLTFYGGSNTPTVGSTYNGKVVTNVYTDFADKQFTSQNDPPWYSVRSDIKVVYTDSSFKDITPTSTAYWFIFLSNCTTMDLTSLNTSKVATMTNMFYGCSSLTNIIRDTWDTSNVTDMGYMFSNCSSLVELNVSDFDTSNVTRMSVMFSNCSSLTDLDVSNFNTSKVTMMTEMFGALTLKTLDVSNFNTSKVIDMQYMFAGCTSLTTIYSDDSRFVTSAVTSSLEMFVNDTSLVGGNGTKYNSNYRDATYAHVDTASNPGYFTQGDSITAFAVYSEDDDTFTFYSSKTTNVPAVGSSYNGKKVTNIYTGMDKDMYSAIEPWYDLRNLIKNVTFDASFKNVQPLYTMFWFYGLSSCTSITNLSNFDTSKVSNAMFMFYGCTGITELDISNFDTSSLANTQMMFYDCTNLKTIYSNDNMFNASGISNDSSMFTNCTSIIGGNGTTYSSSKVDSSMAHVDTSSNPGYFTAK